ncbi:MFS transporter [Pseudonocardia sp. TRM90224]|uniref:MFS transporter n=1 Tax=Pseudonocardia sp. TRM90224 TaxID=2812678 RepID=UPI001E552C7D|nr:MFS transporter [Pseudonocardia sp. TRM90224]
MSLTASPAPPTRARPPLLGLVALAFPTLLIAIDISVMNVALPSIGRDLQPSAAELLWISDSYNYLVAGSMLTMGALGDRVGRRRMIIICAAVFALASAAGAFATSAAMLILARAVMGIAGSAIMPASMSLIGVLFGEQKARIQAMGAYMTVFLLGMAVAPFVGGILLAHFSWGSVFLVGVPVMVVTMITVPLLLPETRAEAAPPIDLLSTAQSIGAVLGLVYALKTWVNDGAGLGVWLALASGTLLAVLFVRRQRRLEHPLLDLALLTGGAVRRALAALFLTSLIMGGVSLFFSLYLQEVQGLTPLEAAWWTLPQIVAMILAANGGPLLRRRLEHHTVVLTCVAIMAVGFALSALIPVSWAGRPLAAGGFALATLGIGAAYPLLMDLVISASPPERAGAGAALAQLSNEMGIALGLTVLGTLGTIVYRGVLDLPGKASTSVVAGVSEATAHSDSALLDAVRGAFTTSYNVVGLVGVGVLALVAGLVFHRRRPST